MSLKRNSILKLGYLRKWNTLKYVEWCEDNFKVFLAWAYIELSLVQILFVVAITIMKTNRNEVRKGFLQRLIQQELVGIKENR